MWSKNAEYDFGQLVEAITNRASPEWQRYFREVEKIATNGSWMRVDGVDHNGNPHHVSIPAEDIYMTQKDYETEVLSRYSKLLYGDDGPPVQGDDQGEEAEGHGRPEVGEELVYCYREWDGGNMWEAWTEPASVQLIQGNAIIQREPGGKTIMVDKDEERAKEIGKIAYTSPSGKCYDANGNIVEVPKPAKGTKSGGICGHGLCTCTGADIWVEARQMFYCKGCYDDYNRLYGSNSSRW